MENKPDICDFSSTLLSERAREISSSVTPKSPRIDQIRLLWFKFVNDYTKYCDMQEVFEFMKITGVLKKLRAQKLHSVFNKYYRRTMKKRWQRFSSRLLNRSVHEKFSRKSRQFCELRARETAKFIVNNHSFCDVDFRFLVPESHTNEAVVALRGNKEMKDKTPLHRRKSAIYLYSFALIVAIVLGVYLYRLLHSGLYYFLNLGKSRNTVTVKEESIFKDVDSLPQQEVIEDALHIVD